MSDNIIKGRHIFMAILAFVALLVVLDGFVIIDAGHRGVVVSRVSGVQDTVYGEGFNLKMPLIDKVYEYEVRTQKFQKQSKSTTEDQQIVTTTVALNYNIDANEANKLHQDIGVTYESRILDPSIEGAVKSIMAKYEASQLITNRSQVSLDIQEEMKSRLDTRFLTVTDFNLVNIKFSTEYTNAIEDKVVEEQKVEKEKRRLERVEIQQQQKVKKAQAEAEAKVIQARADAQAIQIRQQSLRNSPEFLQYYMMERWNGVLPNVVGSGSQGGLGVLLDMEINSSRGEPTNLSQTLVTDDMDFIQGEKSDEAQRAYYGQKTSNMTQS